MRLCALLNLLIALVGCSSVNQRSEENYEVSFDVKKAKPKFAQKSKPAHHSHLAETASWRLGMNAALIPDFLSSSGELLYGDTKTNQQADDISDWDQYLMKLGVNGQQNDFGYGFDFYSVGKKYKDRFNSKYKNKKGLAGYDSWLSLNIDKLVLKTKYKESWTNNLSSTNTIFAIDRWFEIETSYPFTRAPFTELSFSYGLGKRKKTTLTDDTLTYQGPLDSIKTKFKYIDQYINLSTEINRSSSRNRLGNQQGYRKEMVYFNGKLFPGKLFSILSSYRYSIQTYNGNATHRKLNKLESTLGLIYRPLHFPGKIKLTSAYNNYKSNDGLTHKDIVKVAAQLDWRYREPYSGLLSDWTLDLGYKDVSDYIQPGSSQAGLNFNLLWNLPIR